MHTHVNACDCTGGCTETFKRVCTERWLWEKNPLPHWEIEPASAVWQSNTLTNWATSPPEGCSLGNYLKCTLPTSYCADVLVSYSYSVIVQLNVLIRGWVRVREWGGGEGEDLSTLTKPRTTSLKKSSSYSRVKNWCPRWVLDSHCHNLPSATVLLEWRKWCLKVDDLQLEARAQWDLPYVITLQ